jgi:hypothetical protein
VSENSVGKASVSGVLCQREAELVRCGSWKAPWTETELELRFANRLVPVLVRISIENGNSG